MQQQLFQNTLTNTVPEIHNEIWKPVVGFSDMYEVSNMGEVRYKRTGALKPQHITSYGYKNVSINFNKKQKYYLVHRLVAIAFIENTDNKPEVNHKDFNKVNNHVYNLEWCTHLENMQHAMIGDVMNKYSRYYILTEEDKEDIIKYRKWGMLDHKISNSMGICLDIVRNFIKKSA